MEITKEQKMAYKEVIEVLKYVPQEDVNKISKEKLDFYKNNMDNNYNFEIDINKDFEEQNLSETAKVILAIIFRDYWATPEQKEKILKKEKYDIEKKEQEKREKYSTTDIFKKKENANANVNVQENVEENSLTIYKKEKWYISFINFFKKIFNRK